MENVSRPTLSLPDYWWLEILHRYGDCAWINLCIPWSKWPTLPFKSLTKWWIYVDVIIFLYILGQTSWSLTWENHRILFILKQNEYEFWKFCTHECIVYIIGQPFNCVDMTRIITFLRLLIAMSCVFLEPILFDTKTHIARARLPVHYNYWLASCKPSILVSYWHLNLSQSESLTCLMQTVCTFI